MNAVPVAGTAFRERERALLRELPVLSGGGVALQSRGYVVSKKNGQKKRDKKVMIWLVAFDICLLSRYLALFAR